MIYHYSPDDELSQGDILRDVRIMVGLTDAETNQPIHDHSNVIVLSRNCEISKPMSAGDSVLIARVIPLAQAPIDRRGNIKNQGTINTYYLPAYEHRLSESFIDWRTFQPVHKTYLYRLRASTESYRCSLHKDQIKLCIGGFIWFLTKPDDEEIEQNDSN